METVVAEKKVPLGAQKEPFLVAGFLEPFLDFFYGTEDHLGSTRMVLSAQNGGGSEITQALMYQPYGTVSDVQGINTASTDPLRQKFTTKEFDEDGEGNEASGIKAFYFGVRMYDPSLGLWQARDPKQQFWNPYKYSANPIRTIDPNGEFALFSPVLTIYNLVKSIQIAAKSGSFGDGLANFSWNVLMSPDPVTSSLTFGGIEMVTNIVANYEGWANGNSGKFAFWQGAGKFLASGVSGWTTGHLSGFNASTYGILNKPLGAASAGVQTAGQHIAFGGGGDYNTSKRVLQKLYSYGASGSVIKLGGDITWANHVVNEGPFVYDNWYDEAKNRYTIMSGKIGGSQVENTDYGRYGTGNNDTKKGVGFGHTILGGLLPNKAWYYGFETWGEPYERWVIDDYMDDHDFNRRITYPFGDTNAEEGGTMNRNIGWESAW